jgi:aldehyde dehydrogenase (NAD+)
MNYPEIFDQLRLSECNSGVCAGQWLKDPSGKVLSSISPIDGQVLARVQQAGEAEYEQVMATATGAFASWRLRPAPLRGEVIRQLGEALRKYK